MNTSNEQLLSPEVIAGIAVSILLHVVFILVLNLNTAARLPEQIIDAAIVLELPVKDSVQPKKQQIVSPTTSEETKTAREDSALSEKNKIVEEEQLKRGAGDAPIDNQKTAAQERVEKSILKPSSEKALPAGSKQNQDFSPEKSDNRGEKKIRTLKLDRATLLEKFTSTEESNSTDKSPSLNDYRPFSRPMGTGAKFFGNSGSTDYLPNLPDGDITLLNTKADHFAVFVRRVAARVFAALRSSGWETLSTAEINSLTRFSTVVAELSLDGELLNTQLDTGSGSPRFDAALTFAVKQAARDPHPPQEAVSPNGNIVFIFKAKSWAESGVNGRTGAFVERRWLLLGVGLE